VALIRIIISVHIINAWSAQSSGKRFPAQLQAEVPGLIPSNKNVRASLQNKWIGLMGKLLNVLFIEDSEADAELTTAELARGGFIPYTERVETRHSMLDALTKAEWDVILCDYSMPRFSAEAALQTLKESGQDIPFIITSGAVDAEDTVNLLKQGAHDFMNKEALARLVPAIEREIREAEVRRQRRLAEERVRILSSAVQQSPVSVLITDPQGKIEYVNPKYEQITGYASSEAIGRDLGFTLLNQTSTDAMAAMRHSISNAQEWRG